MTTFVPQWPLRATEHWVVLLLDARGQLLHAHAGSTFEEAALSVFEILGGKSALDGRTVPVSEVGTPSDRSRE